MEIERRFNSLFGQILCQTHTYFDSDCEDSQESSVPHVSHCLHTELGELKRRHPDLHHDDNEDSGNRMKRKYVPDHHSNQHSNHVTAAERRDVCMSDVHSDDSSADSDDPGSDTDDSTCDSGGDHDCVDDLGVNGYLDLGDDVRRVSPLTDVDGVPGSKEVPGSGENAVYARIPRSADFLKSGEVTRFESNLKKDQISRFDGIPRSEESPMVKGVPRSQDMPTANGIPWSEGIPDNAADETLTLTSDDITSGNRAGTLPDIRKPDDVSRRQSLDLNSPTKRDEQNSATLFPDIPINDRSNNKGNRRGNNDQTLALPSIIMTKQSVTDGDPAINHHDRNDNMTPNNKTPNNRSPNNRTPNNRSPHNRSPHDRTPPEFFMTPPGRTKIRKKSIQEERLTAAATVVTNLKSWQRKSAFSGDVVTFQERLPPDVKDKLTMDEDPPASGKAKKRTPPELIKTTGLGAYNFAHLKQKLKIIEPKQKITFGGTARAMVIRARISSRTELPVVLDWEDGGKRGPYSLRKIAFNPFGMDHKPLPKMTPWSTRKYHAAAEGVRFDVPGDLRVLQGLTPLGYLKKYIKVSKELTHHYREAFLHTTARHSAALKKTFRHGQPRLLHRDFIFPALNKLFYNNIGRMNYRKINNLVVKYGTGDVDTCPMGDNRRQESCRYSIVDSSRKDSSSSDSSDDSLHSRVSANLKSEVSRDVSRDGTRQVKFPDITGISGVDRERSPSREVIPGREVIARRESAPEKFNDTTDHHGIDMDTFCGLAAFCERRYWIMWAEGDEEFTHEQPRGCRSHLEMLDYKTLTINALVKADVPLSVQVVMMSTT